MGIMHVFSVLIVEMAYRDIKDILMKLHTLNIHTNKHEFIKHEFIKRSLISLLFVKSNVMQLVYPVVETVLRSSL